MQLLVFGASGRVGRRVCACAIEDGHTVTAFVPDADSAPADTAVLAGDVTDADAVTEAVGSHDAVCSALGPDAGGDLSVLADGCRNVVRSMEGADVDRIVAVAAAGILQATPSRLRLEREGFPESLRAIAREHRTVYETLRDSSLDWTLVCPPYVSEGAPTNQYQTAVDHLPEGGQSVSAGDVAAFVCETVTSGTHVRDRVGIAY